LRVHYLVFLWLSLTERSGSGLLFDDAAQWFLGMMSDWVTTPGPAGVENFIHTP